jgi:hypothetical protein
MMKRAMTLGRNMRQLVATGAILIGVALVPPGPSSAALISNGDILQLSGGTRTNEGGQVTVSATWPGNSDELVFAVVMDTHAVNLDAYDLLPLAVLRTDTGAEVQPIGWAAPPGGHHREGTLSFPATDASGNPVITSDSRSVELIVRDVAGVPERIFRWEW